MMLTILMQYAILIVLLQKLFGIFKMSVLENLKAKQRKTKHNSKVVNFRFFDLEFLAYKKLRNKLKCSTRELFIFGVKALGEIDPEVQTMIDESWEEAKKCIDEKKKETPKDCDDSKMSSFFTLREVVNPTDPNCP